MISKERQEQYESRIRNTATELKVKIEEFNELDPVAASGVAKQILQYLMENVSVREKFTIKELEDLGYMPKV